MPRFMAALHYYFPCSVCITCLSDNSFRDIDEPLTRFDVCGARRQCAYDKVCSSGMFLLLGARGDLSAFRDTLTRTRLHFSSSLHTSDLSHP